MVTNLLTPLITKSPETVLLLTIDCLRADTARDSMPTLGQLANEGFTFPNCYAVGSGTPTSMPGVMQSRLPTDDGGAPKAHPLVDTPTLAERLSEADFACAGWHSNVYTSERFGYERGFDVFADLQTDNPLRRVGEQQSETDTEDSWLTLARRLSEHVNVETTAKRFFYWLRNQGLIDYRPHIRAERLTHAAEKWLPDRPDGRRRFGWLHYMDLHSPYTPPRRYRELCAGAPVGKRQLWKLNEKLRTRPQKLDADEISALKSLYVAGAEYVDNQISSLVDSLKSRNLWEKTLVVITSDHGEMFDDHPIPDDYPFQHPNYLGEIVTHVPLIFAGGCIEPSRTEVLTSNMDIAPTILDALNVTPPTEWHGLPAWSEESTDREGIFSVTGRGTRQDNTPGSIPPETLHVSLRTDTDATLWWSSQSKDIEFYARENGSERQIQTTDDAEHRVTTIENRFATVTEDLAGAGATQKSIDPEMEDRLRDLGYID